MRHTYIKGLDKGNAQGIIVYIIFTLYSHYIHIIQLVYELRPEKISISSRNLTTA